ncbi:MAG TPA: hypothetical protein DFS52_06270 [Myxococcales bacterium]|nr:hypothetical protein [Myxococcales bacterium]
MPAIAALRIKLEARGAGRLPTLWTTALHGTLFSSLRELACFDSDRSDCTGCDRLGDCSYAALAEPPGDPDKGEGVTDRAPPALVLAPESADFSAPAFELERGGVIAARLALIGDRAIEHRSLLVGALNRAASRMHGGTAGREGFLRLVSVEPVDTEHRPMPPRARLSFVTPVRLKSQGRIQSELDAEVLWRSLARRADSLSRLYGAGPLGWDPAAPSPFALETLESRVVAVQRFSNRQKTSMTWPGVLADCLLTGDGLATAWPLLQFGSQVQVGKATSFGFGRYRLEEA